MRLVKLGLTTVALVAAMAFAGVTSAMAENTLLCTTDDVTCSTPSTLHFLSVVLNTNTNKYEDAKTKLVTPNITIECNVLVSATRTSAALASPVVFAGTLTYTNCGACTVTVVINGNIKILKLGVELADLTGEGFVINFNCLFGSINCDYDFTGLVGHFLGGLTLTADAEEKAHVTFVNAALNAVAELGGFIGCPAEAKLTALFQSLTKLYVQP